MSYYEYDGNRGGFLSRFPVVTKNILIINVFMYLFTYLRPDFMYGTFALYFPTSPLFHWWQPVTHMFMHGGFWHLFANMFTFLMFGAVLERQWGPKKYLLFYMVTGLGAAGLHLLVNWLMGPVGLNVPMVGASGAIYGVLMGFAMLFPETTITLLFPPIPLKAKYWILIWLAIELFTGVTGMGGGIAHFAHLGGALFGWILVRIWKKNGTMYNYYED